MWSQRCSRKTSSSARSVRTSNVEPSPLTDRVLGMPQTEALEILHLELYARPFVVYTDVYVRQCRSTSKMNLTFSPGARFGETVLAGRYQQKQRDLRDSTQSGVSGVGLGLHQLPMLPRRSSDKDRKSLYKTAKPRICDIETANLPPRRSTSSRSHCFSTECCSAGWPLVQYASDSCRMLRVRPSILSGHGPADENE
jgi:hypothetical protein